jgi:hypothetical protein
MKENNYHTNEIKKICLYKQGNVWVFDDAYLGLKAEAFVLGATEAIQMILDKVNTLTNKKTHTMIFSENKIPDYHAKIELIEDNGRDAWYELNDHKLWLCGVLSMFFAKSPKQIYVKFQD